MKLSIVLLFITAALTATARTIDVTPGSLAGELENSTPPAELTLRGSIDARDFATLRDLDCFTTLDLSQVEIAEYSSTIPLFPGRTYFAAATLPECALFGMSAEHITLPSRLNKIGAAALAGTAVRTLTIPEGVTAIADNALYDSRQLTVLTLPSTLASLGANAIASCPSLTSVNLEATVVRHLPDGCLAGAESLKGVNLTNITKLGREVFAGSGIVHIFLPQCREFAPFALAGMQTVATVSLRDDAIFDRGLLMDNSSMRELRGVPDIVPDLFAANCTTFSPSAAVSTASGVGEFAFANTGASSLVIGRNLTYLSPYAFAGCHALSLIEVKELQSFIPDVDASTFSGVVTTDVTLVVADGCEDAWRSHPVWSKFNIVNATTNVASFPIDDESALSLTVSGGEIIGRADGSAGLTLSVYDLEGHRVARTSTADATISLRLADLPSGLLLIDLQGPGGSSRRLKLLN